MNEVSDPLVFTMSFWHCPRDKIQALQLHLSSCEYDQICIPRGHFTGFYFDTFKELTRPMTAKCH